MDKVKENFSNEEKNIKGKKKQFYEYGAHFKYENLCETLNKLKIRNLSGNEERKLSNNKRNTLDVKSRNIKLNNQMRSINLYLGNKNKENKTSLLPKTDNLKHKINNHNEKINDKKIINKKDKNSKNNIYKKNNNKGNAKSTSQPKRIIIQNISKNEFKKILDSNSNSLKISTLSNKKTNYYNIKTENLNLDKKDKLNNLKKKKINSSSQSKSKKNQVKTKVNNNLLVNDKSEIINNICLKPIDYLSLSKNFDKRKNESNSNSKSKNLTKEKLRPKSTQKMESKNIIKKKLLKITKNKNELLDSKSKSKSRTISSKGNKNCNSKKKLISKTKNNINKYDKLSKNIFMNKSFKNKIKYSSINYINNSINKTNDNKMKTINQNTSITIDSLSKEKKSKKLSKITKKMISRNNIYSDLNLTTSLNKNKILISPTSKIKKQIEGNKINNKKSPDENNLILKKINNCKIINNNIKNKNDSYHIDDKIKNIKNKDKNNDMNIIEKLKKEYKGKMNLIIQRMSKVEIKNKK